MIDATINEHHAAQKKPDDRNHEKRAEQQVVVDGAERFAHEIRSVVERADPHAFRQDALVQLPDLFVDAVEDDARIFAPTEKREAFCDFSVHVVADRPEPRSV